MPKFTLAHRNSLHAEWQVDFCIMPSSKGYHPTAFHTMTYARQEQRSSKSPSSVQANSTLFRLHFFPAIAPLVQKLPSLVPGINQRSSTMHECLSLQACYPLFHEEMESMTSIVCCWYGYDMGTLQHRPGSPFSCFEALCRGACGNRLPGSYAVLETEEVPITLSVPNADILSPAVRGEHFFAVSSLRRAIRVFNGNGPQNVQHIEAE